MPGYKRAHTLFRLLGISSLLQGFLFCLDVVPAMLFPFVPVDSCADHHTLQLVLYTMDTTALSFAISQDLLPASTTLWAHFCFDYDAYKWKERRAHDLSCRRRRLARLSPILHPEGSSATWDSSPHVACSPIDIAAYCSSTFDETCRLIDILTMPIVESPHEAFCGLLDKTEVGVYMFSESDNLLVFDTGASVSISNEPSDFVSWDQRVDVPSLQGITSAATVQGSGLVRWYLQDDQGNEHCIEIHAYFVPNAKVRLLSPQRYMKQSQHGDLLQTPGSTTFYFNKTSALCTFIA